MSWGGPAVGAAPYQPPPFSNSQPGYNQQPNQHGQQPGYGQYPGGPYPSAGPHQRPPESRLPKKKGNPIITRYPPPPGYRGPAQPQASYPPNQYPNQYQPPQQGYNQGYSTPAAYPIQGYSAPQTYPPTPSYSPQGYGPPQHYPLQSNLPQQGFSTAPTQNYQYPQSNYPPAQGYSQPPNYPGAQGYAPQQTSHQGYPPQSAPADPVQQPYPPQQGWQPPNAQAPYPSNGPYYPYGGPQDPNATPTPISAHPATAQHTPTTGQPASATSENNDKPPLFLAWDDWDFDFDGAIWPKSNEPIDPTLSLGVIIWRPAKQVTRALPSTYEEAEEQALKPPAEKLGNGEAVSMYFTLEKSHEAFLDVRQTDDWRKIKNDPIFVVFPDEKDMDLIPLEECIAKRDRPDEPWEDSQEEEDEEMQDSSWNIMDNLEQALSGQDASAKPPTSQKRQILSTNRAQEDILAMLGVTGSPKPPSNQPMPIPFPTPDEGPPATLPEKPPVPPSAQFHSRPDNPSQRAHSYGGHGHSSSEAPPQRPYGSLSASTDRRPAPPPTDRQEYDPWNPRDDQTLANGHSFGGSRESPARSEASNHTLAGSDFETDTPANDTDTVQMTTADTSSAPVPTLERSDSSFSRKRSYGDTDPTDEKLRQQDDHTKRKRRSEVAAAYGRR